MLFIRQTKQSNQTFKAAIEYCFQMSVQFIYNFINKLKATDILLLALLLATFHFLTLKILYMANNDREKKKSV